MCAPADVNLTSAVFFCVPARRCGHSLGKLRPTPHHRRKQDVGSPRSHRRDRSEGALHTGRHLSPPSERTRQTGRRAARSAHVAAAIGYTFPTSAEGVSARKREAEENGQEGAKSRELSSENAEKVTANAELSPDCVAYVVRTSRPRATIAQARKNGPLSSFRGRGRTDLLSGHCARRRRILVSDEVTIAQRLG